MEDDDKKLPLNYLFKIKIKEKEIIFIFYSNYIYEFPNFNEEYKICLRMNK
jgi:hypothetical protein